MTRQNELDLRGAERFDKTKVLLAGNPEHPVHTFIFERSNEKFGALGNGFVPRGFNLPTGAAAQYSAGLGLGCNNFDLEQEFGPRSINISNRLW
jgi:hypothetical protein